MSASIDPMVTWARERARLLYDGTRVAHRSCGVAIAETFGRDGRTYVGLRKGGLTGMGPCGAILGGKLVLAEVLGDPDPLAPATPALIAAAERFDALLRERLALPEGASVPVCATLTAPLGDFKGAVRHGFCRDLAADVAAVVAACLREQGVQIETLPEPAR